MSVCDISKKLSMSMSAISHQLRVLKNSRLVKYRKVGKSVLYSLDDDHVKTIINMGVEHISELNISRKDYTMKKTFKLEELDCANCAAKMETAIGKIDGVIEAKVSFMTQKLSIEAEEKDFETILKAAQKAIKKIEPDCRLIIE